MKNVTTHYDWIDAAKALGILSVVIGHCSSFIFQNGESIGTLFVMSYYMPLFFIASGFVRYKNLFDEKNTKLLRYKNFVVLVPFLIIGLLHNIICNGDDIVVACHNLFFDERCSGYWFLLVLFMIDYSTILGGRLPFGKTKYLRLVVPFICGGGICLILNQIGFHSLKQYFIYYPYFAMGATFRKKNILYFLDSKKLILLVVLSLVSFITYVILVGHYTKVLWLIQYPITVTLFALLSNMKWNATKYALHFIQIGKMSLYIYCLHYFILAYLTRINFSSVVGYHTYNYVAQVTVLFLVAIIVCELSMLLGKAIQKNKYLDFVLFGKIIK